MNSDDDQSSNQRTSMAETRQRLSKLLSREKALRARVEVNVNTKNFDEGAGEKATIERGRNTNSPQRLFRTSTTSISSVPSSSSSSTFRSRARSTSPGSSTKRGTISFSVRERVAPSSSTLSFGQRVSGMYAEAFSDEEIFLQGLDAGRLEDISNALQTCTTNIQSADTVETIMTQINAIRGELSKVGIGCVQLWLSEPGGGLWNTRKDGRRISLSGINARRLLGLTNNGGNRFTSGNNIGKHGNNDHNEKGETLSISPSDDAWNDFETALRSVEADDGGTGAGGVRGTFRGIYIIPLPKLTSLGLSVGSIIAADILNQAIPLSISRRPSYGNALRIKILFAQKCLEKIAQVVGWRLREITEENDKFQLISAVNDAKAVSDTMRQLFDCSMKLADTTDLNTTAHILVNAGVEALRARMCWCLWQTGEAPSVKSDDGSDTAYEWVTLYTSGIVGQQRPVALQMNALSGLLARLMNYNLDSMQPLLLTASSHDLAASRMIDEPISGADVPLVSFPVCIRNSWGQKARCCIVLALHSTGEKDEMLSHAETLISIAEKAFSRVYTSIKATMSTKLSRVSGMLFESIGQVDKGHIVALMLAVQKDGVAKSLGARRAALLAGGSVISSAQNSILSPSTDNSISFLHAQSSLSHAVSASSASSTASSPSLSANNVTTMRKVFSASSSDLASSFLWLRELLDGHIVHVPVTQRELTASERSSFAPFTSDPQAIVRGDVEIQQLRRLVLAVDPGAQSGLLIPIRSQAGLCILLLIDRYHDEGLSESHEFGAIRQAQNASISPMFEMIPGLHGENSLLSQFTSFDASNFASSTLCFELASAVDSVVQLQKAQITIGENQRQKQQVSSLGDKLWKQRAQVHASQCLAKWRVQYERKMLRASDSKHLKLMAASVDLLKIGGSIGGMGQTNNSKALHQYLSSVERHAVSLFPFDAVVVSIGDEHIGGSFVAGINDVVIYANGIQDPEMMQQRVPVRIPDGSRSVLIGHIFKRPLGGASSPVNPSNNTANGGGNSQNGGGDALLGTIRITRAKESNRAKDVIRQFSLEEIDCLGKLCEICSEVYLALRRGSIPDTGDGNVQGLVIPMLAQLLPALLDLSTKDGADFHVVMPLLALWLKRICGGDVALLRLLTPSRLVGANGSVQTVSANTSGVGAPEILVSSEDADPRLCTLIKEVQSTNIRNLVYDSSNASSGISVKESDGELRRFDQLVMKLLRETGHSEVIGEIKILGGSKKAIFDSDHNSVVQLIAYVLAHSFSTSQRIKALELDGMRADAAARDFEIAANNSSKELALEKATSDAMRKRLGAALSLLMFSTQCTQANSLAQLSALIQEGLPSVLGTKTAILMMKDDGDDRSFKVVTPSLAGGGAIGNLTSTAADQRIGYAQLSRVTPFTENPSSSQSVILLHNKTSVDPYGAILLFRTTEVVDETRSIDSRGQWHGLEDVLIAGINAIVGSCVSKVQKDDIISNLHDKCKDREELAQELARVSDLKLQVDSNYSRAVNEIATLKENLKASEEKRARDAAKAEESQHSMIVKHDSLCNALQDRISLIESELAEAEETKSQIASNKGELISLMMNFAFDHRCHHEGVTSWLADIAAQREISLKIVSQGEGGTLAGGEGIRGIFAAVGEAMRASNIVEIFTSYSPPAQSIPVSGNVTNSSTSTNSSVRTIMQDTLASASKTENVCVLLVPNRATSSQSKNDYACFVFMKYVRGKSSNEGCFTQQEKDILNCAASLASRSLVRNNVKYNADDFRRLEYSILKEKDTVTRLKAAISVSESLWQKGCVSKAEACRAIESGVVSLLTRGDSDPFGIDSTIFFPPGVAEVPVDSSQPMRAQDQHGMFQFLAVQGLGNELDIVNRVLNLGRSSRKGGVVWTPMKNAEGEIVALLRAERKLIANLEGEALASKGLAKQVPDSSSLPSTSSVLVGKPISATTLGVGSIPKVASTTDGTIAPTPKLADLMITEEEEDTLCAYCRLAHPLLDRVKYFADAYNGVQMAGQAISALQNIQASLEDRMAIEVGRRLELEEAIKAGANMLGSTTSLRLAKGQLLDAAKRSLLQVVLSDDCVIITPKIAEAFNPMLPAAVRVSPDGAIDEDDDPNALYTLEADQPYPLRVRFETGDMEAIAMHSCKATVAPAEGRVGGQWQSWAMRRYQTQLQIAGEEPLDLDNTYALTVPFLFRNGGRAVVTLLRRSGPYTQTDKECVMWITRVLVFCLEMRGGDETVQENSQRVAILQKEVDRLRNLDRRLVLMELDIDNLERDLAIASSFQDSSFIISETDLPTSPSSTLHPSQSDANNEDTPFALDTPEGMDSNMNEQHNKLVEHEGSHIILLSLKTIFGAVRVQPSTSSEAEGCVGENINFDRNAGITSSASVGVVQSTNGKILFWLTHSSNGGSVVGGPHTNTVININNLALEREYYSGSSSSLEDRMVSNAPLPLISSRSVEVPVDSVLFVAVQHHGYPTTWIKVEFETPGVMQVRLRLLLLLRLLDAQMLWRSHLSKAVKRLSEKNVKISTLQRKIQVESGNHKKKIQDMEATHSALVSKLEEDHKLASSIRGSQHRNAESMMHAALIACNVLREEVRAVVHANMQGDWLRTSLLRLCTSVSVATSSDVAVGALSILQGKDSIGGPISNSFGVNWFTNEPNLTWATGMGYGRGEDVRNADVVSKTIYSIDRTNPIFHAVTTGSIIVIGSAEDQPTLQACIDNVGSTLKGGKSLATILPPSNGYRLGTLVVPVLLPSRNSTIIIVVKPPPDRLSSSEGLALPSSSSISDATINVASANESICPAIMSAMLASWTSIVDTIVYSVIARDQVYAKRNRDRNIGFLRLARVYALRHNVTRSKSLAFLRLKLRYVQSKLATAHKQGQLLASTRHAVRLCEQSAADVAEMIKGMHRASKGIPNGVAGLWTHASHTLFSIVSSYVSVKSCGLFIMTSTGDAAELSIRELSTPLREERERESNPSSSASPYSTNNTLDMRPVDELGDKVKELVMELLSNPQNSRHKADKIVKLTRLDSGGDDGIDGYSHGAEEQLWLVPVRMSRSVIAILRVTLELQAGSPVKSDRKRYNASSSSSSLSLETPPHYVSVPDLDSGISGKSSGRGNAGSNWSGGVDVESDAAVSFQDTIEFEYNDSAFRTKSSSSSDPPSNSSATSSSSSIHPNVHTHPDLESRIDTAQLNCMKFAEVFAPLMSAAQQVDVSRLAIIQLEDVVREGGRKNRKVASELALEKKTLSLLFSSLSVVRQAASHQFSSGSPEEHPAVGFCARVANLLTDAFKAQVRIHLYGADGINSEQVDRDMGSVREGGKAGVDGSNRRDIQIISDLLLNERGAVIGTISVSTEATGSGLGSSGNKYVKDVKSYAMKDLEDPAPGIRKADDEFLIGGSSSNDPLRGNSDDGSQKKLDFLTATTLSQTAVDLEVISVVLKPLAITLSGILSCLSRERDAQGLLRAAIQEREIVEREVGKMKDLENEVKHMQSVVEFYRSVADIVNRCLVYGAAADFDMAPSQSMISESSVSNRLATFLRSLCQRLPTMVDSSCVFSFAVLDERAGVDAVSASVGSFDKNDEAIDFIAPTSHDAGALVIGGQLCWIQDPPSSLPPPLPTHKIAILNENSREIADNLAIQSMLKKQKSSVDISQGPVGGGGKSTGGIAGSGTTLPSTVAIRVLSYPLLPPASSNPCPALGVMRVTFPADMDPNDIDPLCEDLSRAVSCAVYEEFRRLCVASRLVSLESQMVISEEKKEEEEVMKEVWQQRCDAWRGVASAVATIAAACPSSPSVAHILSSQSMEAALAHTGLSLRVREARSEDGRLAGSIVTNVPIDDTTGLVAEISCDGGMRGGRLSTNANDRERDRENASRKGKYIDSLSLIGDELVDALSATIRGVVEVVKTNQANVVTHTRKYSQAVGKVDKYKKELNAAKELVKSLSHNLQEQQSSYESLQRQANSVLSLYVGPAINEMTALVERVAFMVPSSSTPNPNPIQSRPMNGEASTLDKTLSSSVSSSGNVAQIPPSIPVSIQSAQSIDSTWLWEGITRVMDRTVGRVISSHFPYILSIFVKMPSSSSSNSQSHSHVEGTGDSPDTPFPVRLYSGGLQGVVMDGGVVESVVDTANNSDSRILFVPPSHSHTGMGSVLSQCIQSGGFCEAHATTNTVDLLGLSQQELSSAFDSPHMGGGASRGSVSVLCFGITNGSTDEVKAVIRVVYLGNGIKFERVYPYAPILPSSSASSSSGSGGGSTGVLPLPPSLLPYDSTLFTNSLLRPVLHMSARFLSTLYRAFTQQQSIMKSLSQLSTEIKREKEGREIAELHLSRMRRLHAVVRREANALLDPPIAAGVGNMGGGAGSGVGGTGVKASHPASLTPLTATHDTSIKLLTMLRTLLRSEGQAILLQDLSTEPVTYKVMVTGNALSWAGVGQGTYGVVTKRIGEGASLAEAAMQTHSTICLNDVTADERYSPSLDGQCPPSTSFMAVPLRGRGGAVVGALLAARTPDSAVFGREEIIAAEMVASMGALSLYWCGGLSGVHVELAKGTRQIELLETALKKLTKGKGKK